MVTGGAGFIGSEFIRLLLHLEKPYAVVNYDKLTYAGNLSSLQSVSESSSYIFIRGDICDVAAVESAMRGCQCVVHFAAESHVDRTIDAPATAVQTNVLGTQVLLQAARKVGVSRFLYVSTDEVYGDMVPNEVADENSMLRPSSPYSASKASSDLIVLSYVRTYGFPALITRSSNNYGPFQFPEKFLPLLITNAFENKAVPIYGDGRQQRNWLHVRDNCLGILAVLESGRFGEVYNLGGLELIDNLTLARRILSLMDKPETLISFVQDRPGHDRRYALTCAKAERELGWTPTISLNDGLRQTIAWYGTNREWAERVREGEYQTYYKRQYEDRDRTLRSLSR